MDAFISQFWASTIDGLTIGSIYALVALGYTLVYGVLKLINFAHSEIFMIATIGSLFTINALGVGSPVAGFMLVLYLLLAALAAMAAAGGAAVVLERVAYRPLRRRGSSRLAALISAIGASLFLQEAVALWLGRDNLRFDRIMEKSVLFEIGNGVVRTDKVLVFVAAIAMMIVLDRFVNGSKLGRGIRATAQDPESAVLMGVNIDQVVMVTFLLGGVMAGVAGLLFGVFFELTKFSIGFILGIKAFTAAVLGGIGNLRGALLGGLVLGLIETYGTSVIGLQWRDVISFSILVLILMFRPTGLLGESLSRARA
ncbi:branched-chain amino acid ABC transporter permease [Carbonactinospora thermoautotrophica]|uniref:Branched-chain amino acid ABC transporter permease n=1 Tax=Carbonactinospora thermoautotrophica TaxID=1469144 RepID=A0A132NBI9_9ACTN|nr:branched-chain amino acid ABC transporter permease [Carbonactinospora thermoautotrophica]KWW99872.1 Inner-membrane translocator [Carbonactinospora thermoautotrophica]KWX04414.1 branched-chain amino acid ABC transporter permease [Carbonactinospora thermoautotrophica]KWX07366.1 branched-chain amino acid ABC transporter permease [Carbonactinospora thermoautotrophica]